MANAANADLSRNGGSHTAVAISARGRLARVSSATGPQAYDPVRIGCGRRESDSENGGERASVERPLTSRLVATAGVGRRTGDLGEEHRNRVTAIQGRHTAPLTLAQERSAEQYSVAAVVATDNRCGGPIVMAPARGGRLGATPRSAQQRGVWPNCQCQHDRNKSCSKHGMLTSVREQERRQTTRGETLRDR